MTVTAVTVTPVSVTVRYETARSNAATRAQRAVQRHAVAGQGVYGVYLGGWGIPRCVPGWVYQGGYIPGYPCYSLFYRVLTGFSSFSLPFLIKSGIKPLLFSSKRHKTPYKQA